MKSRNIASGITGTRVDQDTRDEAQHFYVCVACGQAVDMRDLGQVFHHEAAGHTRLETDS